MPIARPRSDRKPRGAILVVVLVLLAVTFTIAVGIADVAFLTVKQGVRVVARASALHLAEAGAHIQRWRLAHAPNDALDHPEPRILALRDATGRAAGTVMVTVTAPDACRSRTIIRSFGQPEASARSTRTVEVVHGRPSLARYAFLTNATLYFAGSGTIDGRIHAASGLRMDADQNALASSAVATYTCGPAHGCVAAGEGKPGIWGSGGGGTNGLWRFPVPPIDFNAITLDLAQAKAAAQNGGIYLPPSGAYGYYLKFKRNGTVDVHRVTHLQRPVWSSDGTRWVKESHDLAGAPALSHAETIPQDACGIRNLLFVEDTVWVDGEVKGRATVIAARLPETPDTHARIYVNGSLTLVDPARDAVALIAQGNLQFPLVLPDTITVSGVLVAQHGRIYRPYYPSTYRPWHIRPELHLRGSLITNGVAVTSWIDSSRTVVSGFQRTTNAFDARYEYDPPPFVPTLSDPVFLEWRER